MKTMKLGRKTFAARDKDGRLFLYYDKLPVKYPSKGEWDNKGHCEFVDESLCKDFKQVRYSDPLPKEISFRVFFKTL